MTQNKFETNGDEAHSERLVPYHAAARTLRHFTATPLLLMAAAARPDEVFRRLAAMAKQSKKMDRH